MVHKGDWLSRGSSEDEESNGSIRSWKRKTIQWCRLGKFNHFLFLFIPSFFLPSFFHPFFLPCYFLSFLLFSFFFCSCLFVILPFLLPHLLFLILYNFPFFAFTIVPTFFPSPLSIFQFPNNIWIEILWFILSLLSLSFILFLFVNLCYHFIPFHPFYTLKLTSSDKVYIYNKFFIIFYNFLFFNFNKFYSKFLSWINLFFCPCAY